MNFKKFDSNIFSENQAKKTHCLQRICKQYYIPFDKE